MIASPLTRTTSSSSEEVFDASLNHRSVLQEKLDKAGVSICAYEIISWLLMRKNIKVAAAAFFFATDLKWAIGAASLRQCAQTLGCSHEYLRREVKQWEIFLLSRKVKISKDGSKNGSDGAAENTRLVILP